MKGSLALFLCLALLFISSCKKDDIKLSGSDYLIFGHFYGFCHGEECIEIFKLTNDKLYEDTNDTYPNAENFYEGDFVELTQEKYMEVRSLMDFFPSELLDESHTVVGTPDAADGGGLYIEIYHKGSRDFWLIDQEKDNVPSEYHDFMDKVNETIGLLK